MRGSAIHLRVRSRFANPGGDYTCGRGLSRTGAILVGTRNNEAPSHRISFAGPGVVALTLPLIYSLGVTGAAWGMLIPIGASGAVLFVVAARMCAMDSWKIAIDIWRGLGLPVVLCVISASSILYLCGNNRLWVVSALVVGGLTYLGTLFGVTGNSEEKQFAHDTLSQLKQAAIFIFRRVRSTVAKVSFLCSTWHFASAFVDCTRPSAETLLL